MSSVCFVLFLGLLTWKTDWDRPVVALIQFLQHSWRHYVGFVRDLVKARSVGFVETAVEHVGLFFVAKKAGADQRFTIDARASNRHFLRPSSGPLLTGERTLRSITPDVVLECSSPDEKEVSLARRKSRADFTEVSLQLLDPSEWRSAAYGRFFREQNIIVLEARFILYAVRYAESCRPPGCLLILSDNLALVLALSKRRSKHLALLYGHASNLCVWLQGRFCLIVQVDTVRVEWFRQGKSLLRP